MTITCHCTHVSYVKEKTGSAHTSFSDRQSALDPYEGFGKLRAGGVNQLGAQIAEQMSGPGRGAQRRAFARACRAPQWQRGRIGRGCCGAKAGRHGPAPKSGVTWWLLRCKRCFSWWLMPREWLQGINSLWRPCFKRWWCTRVVNLVVCGSTMINRFMRCFTPQLRLFPEWHQIRKCIFIVLLPSCPPNPIRDANILRSDVATLLLWKLCGTKYSHKWLNQPSLEIYVKIEWFLYIVVTNISLKILLPGRDLWWELDWVGWKIWCSK